MTLFVYNHGTGRYTHSATWSISEKIWWRYSERYSIYLFSIILIVSDTEYQNTVWQRWCFSSHKNISPLVMSIALISDVIWLMTERDGIAGTGLPAPIPDSGTKSGRGSESSRGGRKKYQSFLNFPFWSSLQTYVHFVDNLMWIGAFLFCKLNCWMPSYFILKFMRSNLTSKDIKSSTQCSFLLKIVLNMKIQLGKDGSPTHMPRHICTHTHYTVSTHAGCLGWGNIHIIITGINC